MLVALIRKKKASAILDGKIGKGSVIVIVARDPGPGMREMLSPTSAIMGAGLGKEVALITTVASQEVLMDL